MNMNMAPQGTGFEAIAEVHLIELFNQIKDLEGNDSIISDAQNKIIECINTVRAEAHKQPLEIGAVEVLHLKSGEGSAVYDPETDTVVGTLESTGIGANQIFTITDEETLRASILKKIAK